MKTQWLPDRIDRALTCDGFVFKDHNARGRYIGTVVAKRPQWVKDNPDKCISEALREIAARRTNSGIPADAHNSAIGRSDAAVELPVDVSPSSQPPTTAMETPTTTTPKMGHGGLMLNGCTYFTTEQFALVLGVSKRTLHRYLEDGNGPPRIKISGVYYERDAMLRWAVDRGFAVMQSRICANG
jgi:Helix-turn-helix domain